MCLHEPFACVKILRDIMKNSKIVSAGIAMFAMLFGAGNVIFPLVLGRDVGDKVWFGLLGFVVMAVIVPLIGLISTMLCDGDYKKLLGKLGKIPGAVVALVCMIIIGPFAIAARCVTVSFASIHPYFDVSLLMYSAIAAGIIFVFTINKNAVIDILGKFLGPIKLGLLSIIVLKGLFSSGAAMETVITASESVVNGLLTGYGTADLLATIFFSGLILSGLKRGYEGGVLDYKKLAIIGLKAGSIGAILLGLVYTGFCLAAANLGSQLVGVERGDIFSAIAQLVLGNVGGLLANMTVAVATLTTAIALNVVFATYISEEVCSGKVSYRGALMVSILITAIMSNLGFSGIMALVGPVVSAIYPALIVLSLVNIANVLYGFDWIKLPVFGTFAATLYLQFGEQIQALIVR